MADDRRQANQPSQQPHRHDDDWITTRHLLGMGAEAGHPNVSEDQLKRWRKDGLLRRPVQRHLEGQRGSTTFWPPGTERQLVALCRLRERHQSHDILLLALWWDDWDVDPDSVRLELLRRIDRGPNSLVPASSDEDERAEFLDQLVAGVDLSRLRGPIGQVVRRAGRSEVDRRALLWSLGATAAGIDLPLEDVDVGLDTEERGLAEILIDGLDLERLGRALSTDADPVDAQTLLGDIAGLSSKTNDMWVSARDTVADGPWDRLCAARTSGRLLLEGVPQIASILQTADPAHPFGQLTLLIDLPLPDRIVLAVVTGLWFGEHMPENLAEVTRAVSAAIPSATAFQQLVDEVPGFAEIVAEAAGDQDRIRELGEERPDVRQALYAFLATHPDIAELLEDGD